MFAVPGWSVSASELKRQTEPASSSQNPPQSSGDAVSSESGSKSKKRKRGHGSDRSSNVTTANLDEMFRRHIEGREDGPGGATSSEKKKKKRKKNKQHDGLTNGAGSKEPSSGEQQSDKAQKDQPDGDENHRKNKKRKKNKDHQRSNDNTPNDDASKEEASAPTELLPPPPPPSNETKLTPLQQSMRQKLLGARFRHLNETLYTTPSSKALELFTANPELFNEYHAGFARQVKESWPSNPVDGYIQTIKTRGAAAPASKKQQKAEGLTPPLPRRPDGLCTIADLGCGDARLASTLTPVAKKLNLKFLSFDLHSPNALVTKADIANLPLADGSVDVAIFCLSLMGTNWIDFVEEAWRVLRDKGECWVAEVKSRFGKVTRNKDKKGPQKPLTKAEKKKLKKMKKKQKAGANDDAGPDVDSEDEIFAEDARDGSGSDETDISAFVEVFRTRGFVLKQESVDKSNKMFVKMEFVKLGAPTRGKHGSAAGAGAGGKKLKFIDDPDDGLTPEEEARVLKPCVYKTR